SQADQNHLVTINPVTGVATDLGVLTYDIAPPLQSGVTTFGVTGLAADSSGNLIASIFGSRSLYRINPSTLQATQLTASTTDSSGIVALDFSPTGVLYGANIARKGLVTIDTTTWQATQVSTPTGFPTLQGIAFAPDGTLWGIGNSEGDISGSGRIYTIDPITGIATLKFGLGLSNDFRAIEFLPVAAVPVPAAVWLFGSGIIGLVGMARRKTSRTTGRY